MSHAIQTYWTGFMTSAEATPIAAGYPAWPAISASVAGKEGTMRFWAEPPADVAMVETAADAACAFWDQLDYEWIDGRQ